MTYTCPVCGYPGLTEPPRTVDCGGSYEICPSCGYQFGVTDDDLDIGYDEWRRRWREKGSPWSGGSGHPVPPGWDPGRQVRALIDGPSEVNGS